MLDFSGERYVRMAAERRSAYARAEPYPHVVIDEFLPAGVCERLIGEFPKPADIEWLKFDRHHSKKLATRGASQFGPATLDVMAHLNSSACLSFLEELTGIAGLIPDPHYEGGGLHQIEPGGFLKVHTDFNYHPRLKLDRRINLIVYLNDDWHEEYGGHLELWDTQVTHAIRKVLPVLNRCVVFSTTDWSYHGHPEKLTCPEGRTRKSLALYYYTNGRPEDEKSAAHGTMWRDRPQAKSALRSAAAGTLRGVASAVEVPAKVLRKMATAIGTRKAG